MVDYRPGPLFLIAQGTWTLPWQPILRLKCSKLADSPSFVVLALQNGFEYRNYYFKRFNVDDLATSCKHLVHFDPVTLEFKRDKDVYPSSITSLVTCAWQHHC